MSNESNNKLTMGRLDVEISFPVGTSRERLMELLSDVLYKPDVVLSDPMSVEEHDWETIESTGISFRYCSDVEDNERVEGSLSYEKLKSLYLHKAIIDELRKDKDRVVGIALENIERWKEVHRPDGMTVKYLDEWKQILDGGSFHRLSKVLTGLDEHSCDLRQNSPFAGVLSDEKRLMVLYEFKEYWKNNFEKKVE